MLFTFNDEIVFRALPMPLLWYLAGKSTACREVLDGMLPVLPSCKENFRTYVRSNDCNARHLTDSDKNTSVGGMANSPEFLLSNC